MKTILLIEDNAIIRENTAEILELAGYAVHTAENGKLGVERALATRPDLVVCDIMMPVLDGYGVLQIFNQNPAAGGGALHLPHRQNRAPRPAPRHGPGCRRLPDQALRQSRAAERHRRTASQV